ncbi:MAG: SseB family protein [Lachnospira sp.]
MSDDILEVMELFDNAIGRVGFDTDENEDLSGNAGIEAAIAQLYQKDDKESFLFLLTVLCARMKCEGHGLVPFVEVGEGFFSDMDIYRLKEGDTVSLDHDVRLRMDTVTQDKEEEWLYLFTSEAELRKQQCGNVIMSIPIKDMLQTALDSDKVSGLVINPFGKYVKLDKKILEFLLQEYEKEWEE